MILELYINYTIVYKIMPFLIEIMSDLIHKVTVNAFYYPEPTPRYAGALAGYLKATVNTKVS